MLPLEIAISEIAISMGVHVTRHSMSVESSAAHDPYAGGGTFSHLFGDFFYLIHVLVRISTILVRITVVLETVLKALLCNTRISTY